MRLRVALILSLACASALFAAEPPPLVTPNQLPAWFPIQGLFEPDWLHAESAPTSTR